MFLVRTTQMIFYQVWQSLLIPNIKLEIMKMLRNIVCNCGDKILLIQGFYCCFRQSTFSAENMRSIYDLLL